MVNTVGLSYLCFNYKQSVLITESNYPGHGNIHYSHANSVIFN